MANISKGDDVSWNTSQGKTHGEVTRKITSDTSIKGHDIKASEQDPQYEVKSKKNRR